MPTQVIINLVIYFAVMVCGLIFVLRTEDYNSDFFGSSRNIAWILYIFFGVIFTLIYGGICWW